MGEDFVEASASLLHNNSNKVQRPNCFVVVLVFAGNSMYVLRWPKERTKERKKERLNEIKERKILDGRWPFHFLFELGKCKLKLIFCKT